MGRNVFRSKERVSSRRNFTIYTSFHVVAINMYINTGETKIKRMIAFRKEPPKVNGGMPCGACREFFMQLSYENRNMEILTDYESRKIVLLKDLIPNWWGDKRYKEN